MEPMICLSITNQGLKEQDIIEEVKEVVQYHVDIVEWRVDAYEYRTDWEKVAQTLRTIHEELGDTPLMLTFRDTLEGGKMEWTNQLWSEYLAFLETNADLYHYVDIEMYNIMKITENEKTHLRDLLHRNNILLIGSYHNFLQMEEEDAIVNRFQSFLNQGIDIIKIAYLTKDNKEVECLIRAATRCHELEKSKQIFIPMGSAGRPVRLHPELTFSSIAYCTTKNQSPIGQVTVNEYRKNRIGK